MTTLFLDIEVVRTSRPDYRERVASTIKPPATMKKPETIEKWEKEEKESAIDEAVNKSVFDGGLCHIVQINYGIDSSVDVKQTDSESGEALVICDFFKALPITEGIKNPKDGHGIRCVVGHNVRDFDLKILRQRCLVLGIKIPSWLKAAIDSKPWDNYVFDTMTEWGGRDKVSMDNLCYYLGIETPKGDLSGDKFGDAWRAKEFERCMDYGRKEIEALRGVYSRMTGRQFNEPLF